MTSTHRLRGFYRVLIFMLLAVILPGSVWAQPRPEHLANLRGRNEAPKILSTNQYPCELLDAFHAGKANARSGDSTQTIQIYELACKDARGVMIRVDANDHIYEVTDCYQAEAERKTKKDAPICILPANRNNHVWLEPVIKPLFPKCELYAVLYVGKAPETGQNIYEVACKGGTSGGSGFYTLNTTATPVTASAYVSCLRAAATSLKCTRTDEKGAIGNFRPLAERASKGCAPTSARFMGGSKDRLYYEVLCADGANLVLVTDTFDQYQSALTCPDATKYGAKCQYGGKAPAALSTAQNSAAPKAKIDLAAYNAMLTAQGKACTATDAYVGTTDTASARQLVEFKCRQSPYGLAGYMPGPGSQAQADLTDCFVAALRKFDCRFYPQAAQKAHITTLVADSNAIRADCVVSAIRYVGAAADQALTVEIACENKRGYIAVITPARDQIEKALPCRIAAGRPDWEKCEIPDNGTYAG
ncbi:MAG: hypothetical protein QM667_01380 [Asticcacaulis sp.]